MNTTIMVTKLEHIRHNYVTSDSTRTCVRQSKNFSVL